MFSRLSWRRGSGSNLRIKVLQTLRCLLVLLYYQTITGVWVAQAHDRPTPFPVHEGQSKPGAASCRPNTQHQECAFSAANLPRDDKVDDRIPVRSMWVRRLDGPTKSRPRCAKERSNASGRLSHQQIPSTDHYRFRVATFGVRSRHRVQKRGQRVATAG